MIFYSKCGRYLRKFSQKTWCKFLHDSDFRLTYCSRYVVFNVYMFMLYVLVDTYTRNKSITYLWKFLKSIKHSQKMEIFAIVVQITHVKLLLQLTMMEWQVWKLYMSGTTLQMTTWLQQNSSMSEAENNLVIYRVDQQNCKTWRVLETLKINLTCFKSHFHLPVVSMGLIADWMGI